MTDFNTLDLHGHTVAEAIEAFVQFYNAQLEKHHPGCLKIIHGYGSSGQGGAIRIKLRSFLDQYADQLRYETGDSYGDPGWTLVYPKTALPDQRQRLADTILQFCSEPKSEEKILREFASLGELAVKQLIRSLAKQGKLKALAKGTKIVYRS